MIPITPIILFCFFSAAIIPRRILRIGKIKSAPKKNVIATDPIVSVQMPLKKIRNIKRLSPNIRILQYPGS